MKKRFLTIFLALCMTLALLPAAALAENSDFTIEGSVLTKYHGPGGHVIIPDGITRIETSAFQSCAGLTSVTIPKSVTTMGTHAFYDCGALKDIYFCGTEAQWKGIKPEYEYLGDDLTEMGVTVHFNSAGPDGQPVTPDQPTTPDKPDSPTAYASTQNVLADGRTVVFQAYALKDEKGNSTNYVKLRDVAYLLNETAAQFAVNWDAANQSIAVTSKSAYTPDGSEMKTPFSGDRPYKVSASPVMLDGKQVELEAILLTDDAGKGYTYFKLRDLGQLLNFNVTWNGSSIVVESDKPYTG